MSPMLLQYLVGLCCLRATPESVDVIVGDMVLDSAADKKRDVDVTVMINDPSGMVSAFKAYEVKQENKPLDVAMIEQLALKLKDMERITHRCIVSASDFTKAAQQKAAKHGVDLYTIKPYEKGALGQFPALEKKGFIPGQIPSKKLLLCWNENVEITLKVPAATVPFAINGADKIFNADGSIHKKYSNFDKFIEELLLRSTEIMLNNESVISKLHPLSAVANPESYQQSSWDQVHTLDVSKDGIFILSSDACFQVIEITLKGLMGFKQDPAEARFYLMKRVSDGDVFAGAIVSTGVRPGSMQAMVVTPDSTTVGIHLIALEERHLNAIRRLRLEE